DGAKWMWQRIFDHEGIRRLLVTSSIEEIQAGQTECDPAGVERYFRQVRRFKEEMMALIHMSAGAPARATELISIQHENDSQAQSQRGVFIDNGMVVFVTGYHKGYKMGRRVKIIHRYVPREVGEVMVYYLWLVEPFVPSLQVIARRQCDYCPWMWQPRPEAEWAPGEDAAEEGEREEAAAMEEDAAEAGGEDADAWSDAEEDWLSGVVPQTIEAAPRNVDGFGDPDRVRRVMYRETEARSGVRTGVAMWRNAYPAIQCRFCHDPSVREALDDIYEAPRAGAGDASIASVRARQAGHSPRMEEMIYGLLLTANPIATMTEQAQFRKVTIDWHRMLRFASSWIEHAVDADLEQRRQKEEQRARQRRWDRIRRIDIDATMTQLYGAEARLRGIQRPALEAMVAQVPRVLAIMRTGGGKSLLFMLPVAATPDDGVTVVVVPTISLRQDLQERCDREHIPCVEWNGKRPLYHAGIIMVMPESAVTKAFGRFIDEKRTMQQLDWIVIDECQVILESHADWRPEVLKLCEMAEKEVQVLYLTATLPPSEDPRFYQAIGVPEADVVRFREATTRPNAAYRVVEYPRGEEEAEVSRLVEEREARYPPPGQIVVYCKTIEQAKGMAEVLRCSVYHRHVGDTAMKKTILLRLTRHMDGRPDRIGCEEGEERCD
ncbi:hypothetical protein B0A55_10261, partial [Friedmanniomyces simplex]